MFYFRLFAVVFFFLTGPGWALGQPLQLPQNAAIATAHPLATAAGEEILRQGGNAFDAAVAISAAIGVVEPYGSGIGGGGFWLLHRARDSMQVMVDGREKAPGGAYRDMYLDDKGEVVPGLSITGPLAAGIPGVPAAMVHIAEKYGRLSLAQSLAPAIRIAREGFKVDSHYRHYAKFRVEDLRKSPAAAAIFLHDGEIPPEGYLLKQEDLARTLEAIAAKGKTGFYEGPLADKIVAGVRDHGGIWSLEDFKAYQVVERKPISVDYGRMRLVSAAPPSSGGIALTEMLNMLSVAEPDDMNEADRIHTLIEVMRRAYRDRAEYLGDTDFVTLPDKLTTAQYAKQLAKSISPDEATPSQILGPVAAEQNGGNNTTHFSVLDTEGNRVAATLSVNYPFGACFVVPGTGFLLNDEMDDFSAKPGVPNAYGLVGAEANAIAPNKRMLSSMSPSFLESENGVAIIGTPGGSRIITMVLLAALKFAETIEGALSTAQALVDLPRFHHQYLPDKVVYEAKAFDEETRQELTLRGHILSQQASPYGDGRSIYGNMQAVVWDKRHNRVTAASDKRGIGEAVVLETRP